ncbi:hypothetical protein Ssi03_47450 [Sphaerisporangium siamense]|uniref:Ribosomal protein S12 methylthiotransferase accessory factor n=1 Tax=Sphaerisporangium siamense TaxID=795645 RepID=A0A7W7D2M4_9ACTN|nr:YcaO-like family protein [Sphaerisporangium siamense]MBB4699118.1 ribosomal protein S12 methylthiotransferase accessory factor [Sphaerisporangium siamense]GII86755.1 hypothetical protein Ssi03_47450 [Sphaerisporangium siamense]
MSGSKNSSEGRTPEERVVALPEAERRVRAALARLGLTPEVLVLAGDAESPGEFPRDSESPGDGELPWDAGSSGDAGSPGDGESAGDGEPCAVACRLRTADAAVPPSAHGMGKGPYDEARVGAVFEALEHHMTGPAGFDPACVVMAETAHLAAGPLAEEPWFLALADMARTSESAATRTWTSWPVGDGSASASAETTVWRSRVVEAAQVSGAAGDGWGAGGRRVACCRYRAFGGGAGVAVPLFLSCPWYVEVHAVGLRERVGDFCDYGHLMRYSCNSGSAIGVTADEALLHALNETVERDALSLLLVCAFLGRERFRPAVVDPATLPSDLARALARAERVAGGPVWLLDITTDLGVPVMLAYVAPAGGRPHRRGSGASASPAHAARRAVAELVQTVAAESLPWSARRGDLRGLARHPELYACGRFDLTAHLRDARTVPLGREPAPAHPRDRLRELVATLVAHGRTPYYRTVAVLPGEITVVHVVVPGLERFMLITDGNLVLPGARGRAAATGTLPANGRRSAGSAD